MDTIQEEEVNVEQVVEKSERLKIDERDLYKAIRKLIIYFTIVVELPSSKGFDINHL